MARSNGCRRSNGRGAGNSFSSTSSWSADKVARSALARTFKRRSCRRTPILAAREAFGQTPSGVAFRVSTRRRAMRGWSNRGQHPVQPMAMGEDGGGTDDDFHTAPLAPRRPLRVPCVGSTLTFSTRGGPRELVRAVSSLTQRQREDVISIGMGGLLGLQVTELPLQLGEWLVANFDPDTMALKLCNGSYISITAADVAVVFGLPNGPVPIVEREGQLVPPELRACREEIRHRKGKITVKALVTQMLEIKDGGEWFRCHFSVIVVSTLITCVSNGYANQRTLHMFRDVNRITDLGWCENLLRSLVTAHGSWTQDRSRKFTGPLLFLTLLYVDRLVVGGRDVPRSVPTLNGWTSELLKAHEAHEITAQGFGHGLLDAPHHPTHLHDPPFEAPLGGHRVPDSTNPVTPEPVPTVTTPLGFAPLFESITADLVVVATRVADLVRQNPTQAFGDHNFKRLAEANKLLQGLAHDDPKATHSADAQHPQTPSHTTMDQEEAFWQNPDNIKALERAEMAALRATTVSDMSTFSLRLTQHSPSQSDEDHTLGIKVSDMPSFSLGFTQDSPSQRNEDRTLGDQGPITPAPQGANRGLQLGDLPTERQRSPAPPLVRLADRKGKRPLNQEPRPFHLVFSPSRSYPTVPIPPIYMVWMWVFNCPNTSRDEVLFCHNDRIATWSDFRTLQEGANVSTAVVDAWSTVLNAREKSRGWGTPSRLFASTTTTVGTVVDTTGTRDERIKLFESRLDADLRASDHVGTATLDMYLFPIIQDGHYYVMSVNFKQYKFDIIDCSSKQMPNDKMYRDAPVDLLDMLSAYVESKRQWARAIRARNLRPKRMQMPWIDTSHEPDSAVFAMRHMEAFTGQPCRAWQCGLQRGNCEQLKSLRRRFLHNILLADANENMHDVSTRVGRYDCDRLTRPTY